jgi:hypothetical protein
MADLELSHIGGRAPGRDPVAFREALADGTAAIAVGSALAAAFGPELVKSLVTAQTGGQWWFVVLVATALGALLLGLMQRWLQRQVTVGLVAHVLDPKRPPELGRQLAARAEAYARERFTVSFALTSELADNRLDTIGAVDRLAGRVLAALTVAESLAPGASRIGLVPVLTVAPGFRLGARLGHTFARPFVVHSILQGEGTPAYFPAVILRDDNRTADVTNPLRVESPEAITGCNPARSALALDVQGRGPRFAEQVRRACQVYDIGWLVLMQTTSARLPEDRAAFSAVVDQVVDDWRAEAPAHTSRHAVFFSGPVAIAIALGARLANNHPDQWMPFSFDDGEYQPIGLWDTNTS